MQNRRSGGSMMPTNLMHLATQQQQQAQLPAGMPKDPQATLLSAMANMVTVLAYKVQDLAALPGAPQIIGPDMATVVLGITSVNPRPGAAPAQHPMAPVNTKGLSSGGHASMLDSLNRQRPTTPPALFKAPAPQNRSPVTPIMPAQPGLVGSAYAPAALMGGPAPSPPVKACLPRTASDSSNGDSSGDEEGAAAQEPSIKRPRTDLSGLTPDGQLLLAERALAAVLGLKRHTMGPSTLNTTHGNAATPATAAAASAATAPKPAAPMSFGLPPLLPLNSGLLVAFTGPQPKAPLGGITGRAASVSELLEAAEILSGLQNDAHSSPLAASEGPAFSDLWSPLSQLEEEEEEGLDAGDQEWTLHAAAACDGPVKPARKRAAAATGRKPAKGRRAADRRNPNHFQAEADSCDPETRDALIAMWAETHTLPVTCVNHSSGVCAEGTFKLVEGKKKIVFHGPTSYAPEGTLMEPVEFEKAGDRGTTRNWQLSIAVTGMYLHMSNMMELKLGHATRILGVHKADPKAQELEPAAAAEGAQQLELAEQAAPAECDMDTSA